jgi:hypothetical protein
VGPFTGATANRTHDRDIASLLDSRGQGARAIVTHNYLVDCALVSFGRLGNIDRAASL